MTDSILSGPRKRALLHVATRFNMCKYLDQWSIMMLRVKQQHIRLRNPCMPMYTTVSLMMLWVYLCIIQPTLIVVLAELVYKLWFQCLHVPGYIYTRLYLYSVLSVGIISSIWMYWLCVACPPPWFPLHKTVQHAITVTDVVCSE